MLDVPSMEGLGGILSLRLRCRTRANEADVRFGAVGSFIPPTCRRAEALSGLDLKWTMHSDLPSLLGREFAHPTVEQAASAWVRSIDE